MQAPMVGVQDKRVGDDARPGRDTGVGVGGGGDAVEWICEALTTAFLAPQVCWAARHVCMQRCCRGTGNNGCASIDADGALHCDQTIYARILCTHRTLPFACTPCKNVCAFDCTLSMHVAQGTSAFVSVHAQEALTICTLAWMHALTMCTNGQHSCISTCIHGHHERMDAPHASVRHVTPRHSAIELLSHAGRAADGEVASGVGGADASSGCEGRPQPA
eukprot:350809-Chlamydomonas_euryale.AAC.2